MHKVILALALVCAVLTLGWLGTHQQPHIPLHILAGIDRSLSAEAQLGNYAHTLADLASCLDEQDRLTVYRFDHTCQEFYDDRVPGDIEGFKTMLIQTLRPAPAQRGTCPALFLKAVADRLEHSQTPTMVLMLSDGGNDDANTIPQYRQAVQRLAAYPQLKRFLVMGAFPAQRQELRDFFSPLGDRLQLYGPQEISVDRLLGQL